MSVDVNPREAALLVWLTILVVAIFAMKSTRPSAAAVVKAFFASKVVGSVAIAAAYTVSCVWLLAAVNVWTSRNFKTAVFWFVGTAFITMMDISALEKGTKTLRGVAKDAFAVSAIVVFVGGMKTFAFWAEFLLLPFLTLVALMAAIAERKPEHAILVRPLSTLMFGTGFAIIAYSFYRVYAEWQAFETLHQAREFAVPIALTLMFLPFLYGLMLVVAYENAAIGLRFRVEDGRVRRYAWLRGVMAFGLHLELFNRYMQAIKLFGPANREEVRCIVGDLRRARRREKNPPQVEWAQGWSPYDAGDFLADRGLHAAPYHRSFEEEWWAESPLADIAGGIFPDRPAYRIYGTETVATRLSLVLSINTLENPERSDALFYESADRLVARALGDETASRFSEAAARDELASVKAGDFQLSLARDSWGAGKRAGYSRRLTILHPAHCGQPPT